LLFLLAVNPLILDKPLLLGFDSTLLGFFFPLAQPFKIGSSNIANTLDDGKS
jgi:hypothetical protein